ncbi:melanoma-associated antigen 10-like [Manis pentadactyla]|uniref:melanoma-associated antigen 10-like n=1 Tax=Manis pentadactyla TaxID=143292 RepID=UPI00255C71A2|nr:melanoma-associated antigen 10-like [Manis pentadactyla]
MRARTPVVTEAGSDDVPAALRLRDAAQQVMPGHPRKRRRYMPEEGLPTLTETQGLVGAQDPGATEEVASSSSSTSSAYSTNEEEVSMVSPTPSPLQGPERACPSPTASASVPSTQSDGGSGSTVEAGLGTSQVPPEGRSFPSVVINDKTTKLMAFLLLKYLAVEPTTRAEMLEVLGLDHQEYFSLFFSCVSECLQLAFGIDMEEVDPSDHSYILVIALDITYSGQLHNEETLPKSSLLLLLLSIIFMEGGSVPEEKVWEMLGVLGIFPGREHFIFGDPRELIIGVWVQEKYLEYHQVPDSDPARFHLLWGPRAHMETDAVEVLDFLAKVKDRTANACLTWYEEAVRDQEGPGQASIAAADDPAAVAGASSSGTSPGFCPE